MTIKIPENVKSNNKDKFLFNFLSSVNISASTLSPVGKAKSNFKKL